MPGELLAGFIRLALCPTWASSSSISSELYRPESGIYSASLNIMKLVRWSVISRRLRLVQQVWLAYTPPWPQLLYQTSRVGVLNNHRPAARLSGLIRPLKSSCFIQIDL